jgi:hypothetical protein
MACLTDRLAPIRIAGLVLTAILALPGGLRAQNLSSASIGGTVTDNTGGALPGVSVTAASPALQIGQVTTVTDGEGRYRFADLARGVYQLRFELSGFQPLVREGLQLSAGFAARVDVTLSVGALAETVTVSGASPVVDVTSTRGGQTVDTELLTVELPGNRTIGDLVQMTAGLTNTAGENPGSLGLRGRPRFNSYGINSDNSNTTMMIDGFQIIANNPLPDVGATEEVDVKTFGHGAEVKEVGAAMNMIVKSGGNQFHGTASTAYSRQPSGNLDDELRRRGLVVGQEMKYFSDSSTDVGGRILPDKVWFFGSYRERRSKTSQTGLVRNAGPDGKYLTGDEPAAFPKQLARNAAVKLSYQMSPSYQVLGYTTKDRNFNEADIQIAPFGATVDFAHSPWEQTNPFDWKPYVYKGEFRGTPGDQVLFDVQYGKSGYKLYYGVQDEALDKPTMYDRTTLLLTGSNIPHISDFNFWILDANATYFPTSFLGGRHELKFGYHLQRRDNSGARPRNQAGDYALLFDNGVPAEFESNNAPVDPTGWDTVFSVYFTDQWRVGQRLTFNLGLRWDRQHSFVPEQSREEGQFAKQETFPRVEVLTYGRPAPRAAVAWDVTGSGRTVAKATYGWFNAESILADNYNKNSSYTTRYRWRDLNGNRNYDPGEVNLDTNGPDFISTTNTANNRINPDLRLAHVQEVTASVEHELIPNMSVRALYLYRRFGDQFASVNVLRPYSAFNIPLSRKDPGPDGVINTGDDGGFVTIHDYDPAYRGSAFVGNQNLNRPPGRHDSYQSIEGALMKRLSDNWSLQTAYTATKYHRWLVGIPQSPNDEYFPLDDAWRWSLKVNGNYEFPYEIGVGAIMEFLNSPLGQRTYTFRAADPLGGTPLRQQTTVALRLEPFGSRRETAVPLVNLRVGKKFRFGKQFFQVSLDALNVVNSNSVKAASYVSGPGFARVTDVVPPRQIRIGAQFQF